MNRVMPRVLFYIAKTCPNGESFATLELLQQFPQFSPNSIRSVLQRLKKKGFLLAQRKGRQAYYSVNPQKKEQFYQLVSSYVPTAVQILRKPRRRKNDSTFPPR